MTYKKNSNYYIKNNWSKYSENEIFFQTYFLFKQCHYSNKLDYFLYKRRLNFVFLTKLRNFCISTKKKRSLISKLKLSRLAFARKQNYGFLPGIYRSVW